MKDRFSDGNNFYEIREDYILFWGLNIEKPFKVYLDKEIKNYIRKSNLPQKEICEINDDIDVELYKHCFALRNSMDDNDARVVLMNKLISLRVKEDKALLIAIEAGASQIVVNNKYLENLGFKKKIKTRVLEEVCNFYMSE